MQFFIIPHAAKCGEAAVKKSEEAHFSMNN